MKPQDIHMAFSKALKNGSQCLMNDEIKGTTVLLHSLSCENSVIFFQRTDIAGILLLVRGDIEVTAGEVRTHLSNLAVYVAAPAAEFVVMTAHGCQLLELQMHLGPAEYEQMHRDVKTPYFLGYDKAKKYLCCGQVCHRGCAERNDR